mgnify:CR=1 FL=1
MHMTCIPLLSVRLDKNCKESALSLLFWCVFEGVYHWVSTVSKTEQSEESKETLSRTENDDHTSPKFPIASIP